MAHDGPIYAVNLFDIGYREAPLKYNGSRRDTRLDHYSYACAGRLVDPYTPFKLSHQAFNQPHPQGRAGTPVLQTSDPVIRDDKL